MLGDSYFRMSFGEDAASYKGKDINTLDFGRQSGQGLVPGSATC